LKRAFALAVVALACASPESVRHPPSRSSSPQATPSSTAAGAPGASAREAKPRDTGAGGAESTAAPAHQGFAQRYPAEGRISPADWLKSHGARASLAEKDCWDLGTAVGTPPAPALLCVLTKGPPIDKLARIYRLDGARTQRVWEATIGTDSNWLDLVPVLAADGKSLELRDQAPGACERALCQYSEKQAHGILMDFRAVLLRGCRARGVYTYEAGSFTRTTEVPIEPRTSTLVGGEGCER